MRRDSTFALVLKLCSAIMCLASAGLLTTAMVYRATVGEYTRHAPPHTLEGGAGFALGGPILLIGLPGFASGIVGALLFIIAGYLTPKPYTSPALIVSALALVPFVLSGLYIIRMFLR
jgi:hypothetical protein